ncbi:3-hydroxyacyl-CoA dehydrogenase NAD-binding domain-containing protein [Neolewinella lacunae]|uniref:Enoyl-CoA hydratase/isomerase family protein n=1 Tax=Neolewinella lacunae TaxID=1517758 RepID=A0A923PJH7_9BACT|nr:3-hydroxyacyl-CoA dehydrogenase NAD-binding domain-containing protein [Neolewinella lacunae]MBC6994469.1 enoyl-CoA hydratase/isomerase family protein [Neolewinella lacunae]MDN3634162.1 3-hydroxyacyl-CoA dehydrogenase NAD-binding domain-containing protein [Neolewinella lacunae]
MINYRKDTDDIVTLVLDMSGRTSNLLNHQLVTAFQPVIAHLQKEKEAQRLRGVIIASAKSDFLQGGDLAYLRQLTDPAAAFASAQTLKAFLRDLEMPGVPVVAAINGDALGTGFELALACHHRIALADPKIRLGHPEIKIGLIPSGGAVIRLMWLLGIERAFPLLLEGRRYSPQEALKVGIVDALAQDPADLIRKAKAWLLSDPPTRRPWDDPAGTIPGGTAADPNLGHRIRLLTARLSADSNDLYPASRALIDLLAEASKLDFTTAYRLDSRYYAKVVTGEVSKSMISTFWFEKQEVRRGLGRPKGYGKFRPRRVGIIGAGQMGSGIAFLCLRNGLEVVLKDVSQPIADRGREYVVERIDQYIERGTFQPQERQDLLRRITTTDKSTDFVGCDLVVEAVFENKSIKQKVTREAEEQLDEFAIFATNTISIPITELGAESLRPENYVGIHFFPPAEQTSVVEIVKGEKTSEETIARAFDFATAIRKLPVVVKDSWGFFAARVLNTYILEGVTMLNEGYPAALIENMGRQAGMKSGPLALADELGLALILRYEQQAARHYGDQYQQHPAVPTLHKMLDDLGRAGRQKRAGFYEYEADGSALLWTDLETHFPVTKTDYDRRRMKDRFLFSQVIESGWCLQEGVVTERAAANLCSCYGWGFPAYTGGVLRYVESYGREAFLVRCGELMERYGQRFRAPKYLRESMSE